MTTTTEELPNAVQTLLDGSELSEKIGHTFVLAAAASESWPHLALLSVGEVLAVSPHQVRLMLYGASGTTRSLSATGRGLLMVVLDGVIYKVRIATTRCDAADIGGLRAFIGRVERCYQDVVEYAEIRHGIEFTLADPQAALGRWEHQIARLQAVEA